MVAIEQQFPIVKLTTLCKVTLALGSNDKVRPFK